MFLSLIKKLQVDLKRILNFSTHSKWLLQNLCRFTILCQCLGAFTKLRKVSVIFVMSVCPSISMEQLGSQWKDFPEI
jgi:hypothetical protein